MAITKEEKLRNLRGHGGYAYFKDTTSRITFQFDEVKIIGDTIITELFCSDSPSLNLITAKEGSVAYNLAGVTLTSGFPVLTPPPGSIFTGIKCSTNGGVVLRYAPYKEV